MGSKRIWLAGAALVLLPGAALAQAAAPPQPDAPKSTAPKAAPAQKPAAKSAARDATKTVEEITVTGAAAPPVEVSIDKKSYDLSKDLQAQNGSVADALRNLPAVEVDTQGNLSLRGDGNVTILVDGKPSPMFEGKSRADALQQLPADQIARVEVITDPSAALNPEGTGGVINLITKPSRGGGLTGSTYLTLGSAGQKRAGLNLGYNTKTLAVTAAISGVYQHSKTHVTDERDGLDPIANQFLKTFDQDLGRRLTRIPSGRLNLTWTPNDKDQVTAGYSFTQNLGYGYPDDLYTYDDAQGRPATIYDYAGKRRFLELDNGASAGWRHTFAEGHDLSVDLIYNDDLARNHLLNTTTPILNLAPRPLEFIQDDASEHHGEMRVAYTQKLWGGALKAGYELRHEDNEYNYADFQGPTDDSLVRVPGLDNRFVFHQSANAIYATWQRGFGDLDVQLGLRGEDVRWDLAQLTSGDRDNQHYERAYPSLHLSYKLDDDRKLSASYSVRVQRPPVVFLNPLTYIEGPTQAQVGNPDLKVKEVQIYDVGYTQRIGDQNIQADVYFRNAHHDFSEVMTDVGGGRFLSTFGNLGTSQAAGVDFTANGKLTRTLSYNLTLSPYWYSLSGSSNTGTVISGRSLTSSTERATLNWQATPNDSLQLNLVVNGDHIQPQGEISQGPLLNAGWRHKIDDRTSLTMTAQDLTASDRFQRDLESPQLIEHLLVRPVSRQVTLRLDYRFGGGAAKAKTPDFEYENGGGPGPG